jgi:hypothetical protein
MPRTFANSATIAERKQREKERAMQLDMAKRWGVPLSKIEALWNTDKLRKLEEMQTKLKRGQLKEFTWAGVEEEDAVRTIMEEYGFRQDEEWRARQILAKRKDAARVRADEAAVGQPAVKGVRGRRS